MERALWVLLLPLVSSWVACSGDGAGTAAAVAGSATGGVATGGAVTAGGSTSAASGTLEQPSGGTATGGAGGAAPSCVDDTPPNAWASWPLSDPTTQGNPNSRSFILQGDVVVDDVTKLEWQRQVPMQTFTWPDAKQYCDCLALADHDDWQLPSRMELVSIVDYTKQNPSINADAFPDTPFEWFWSASPLAGEDRYWYVAFFDGDTHASTTDRDYRVRCVRHAAGLLPRYDTSVADVVTDASTGLSWQRGASAELLSWAEAKLACDGLALAGGGWRLPSMSELQSLIDESRTDPAINLEAFPDATSEGFWAGTPLAGLATNAWFVSFLDGIAYNALIEHLYRVRCVR